MKLLFNRIKIWNNWRKRSLNSNFYKLLVLLNLANSPTFMAYNVLNLDKFKEFKYLETYESEENT